MNWLHYLLEANLYLGVFYLGYYLFLSRETYYTLNRIYLLFSCVAAFVLPVLQLGILKPVEQPITAVTFAFPVQTIPVNTIHYAPAAQPQFTLQDGLVYAYILGAAILFILLLVKLNQLFRLTRIENLGSDDHYKLIYIDRSETAFSFFNYLFIGTKVHGPETIIKHELVHIRQKHSVDIIFIELLKIINWFNPVIYLLQYSLKNLHEYIADEKTASSEIDALAYSSFLVNNAYGIDGASITNSFFNYNLLKKRIIMLNQKRSGSLARLKYLLAVPICGGLLCASTLAFSKTYGWIDIAPHRIDKNNKSPQVAEPVKRLLVTRNGVSTITDKFSYKRADGSFRIYTANNLSNKDKADLKAKGIVVNVLSNVKPDTGRTHMAPPPTRDPWLDAAIFPVPNQPTEAIAKGNKYFEQVLEINGKPDMRVIIYKKDSTLAAYQKSKATPADIALLQNTYGYTFPAHIKMPPPPPLPPAPSADRLPPPPPAPPANGADRMPPPPPAPPSSDQLAPPPPPAAANFTSRGYKFEQDGYAVNGKIDFRVLITEKDGTQKEFYKSKATTDDLKLLSDKYGYTFPSMQIYTKMPPPPPAAPAAKPTTVKSAEFKSNDAPDDVTLNGVTFTRTRPNNYKAVNPLMIINDVKYYVIGNIDHRLSFSATDSAVVYKDIKRSIEKFGPDGQKGALGLYGDVELTIANRDSTTGKYLR